MHTVEFSLRGDLAFQSLGSSDGLEVIHKLEVIEQTGVQTEVELAAVGAFSVRLLSPSCPQQVVTISASSPLPTLITVTHIETIGSLDFATKHRLATEAASEIGLVPTNIQIF